MRFDRYVALGDSSAEGLDDPDGRGHFRGWADRLAAHVALAQGEVGYANLAVRGRKTREILNEQLAPALAMRPDLVTVFSGVNDVIRSGFDLDAVCGDIATMWNAFRAQGATVLSFTLPDLAAINRRARSATPRVEAMNTALRSIAEQTGTVLVDLAAHSVTADPRLWSEDRLHANSLGHERIAHALAHALGIPGSDGSWAEPLPRLPDPSLAERVGAEWRWTHRHFAPWVWRRIRGRSSGDGIRAKRPELLPLTADY